MRIISKERNAIDIMFLDFNRAFNLDIVKWIYSCLKDHVQKGVHKWFLTRDGHELLSWWIVVVHFSAEQLFGTSQPHLLQ